MLRQQTAIVMKIFFPIFCLILFSNCSAPPSEQQPADGNNLQPVEITTDSIAVKQGANLAKEDGQAHFEKTLEAGKITFHLECGNSIPDTIHVVCTGLENKDVALDYPTEGQLVDAFVLDLDGNSFFELYLVTTDADGTGRLNVRGVSSYRDKSVGDIYVREMATENQGSSDSIYVEDGMLYRKAVGADGLPMVFKYNLKKGEAGFILEAGSADLQIRTQ